MIARANCYFALLVYLLPFVSANGVPDQLTLVSSSLSLSARKPIQHCQAVFAILTAQITSSCEGQCWLTSHSEPATNSRRPGHSNRNAEHRQFQQQQVPVGPHNIVMYDNVSLQQIPHEASLELHCSPSKQCHAEPSIWQISTLPQDSVREETNDTVSHLAYSHTSDCVTLLSTTISQLTPEKPAPKHPTGKYNLQAWLVRLGVVSATLAVYKLQ